MCKANSRAITQVIGHGQPTQSTPDCQRTEQRATFFHQQYIFDLRLNPQALQTLARLDRMSRLLSPASQARLERFD